MAKATSKKSASAGGKAKPKRATKARPAASSAKASAAPEPLLDDGESSLEELIQEAEQSGSDVPSAMAPADETMGAPTPDVFEPDPIPGELPRPEPEPEPADEPEPEGKREPVVPEGAGWAEQVAAARKPPIHLADEESSTVQVAAPRSRPSQEPTLVEARPESAADAPRPTAVTQATGEITLPEQFMTIAIDGQWDDRMERVKPGRMGAALVGSVLLELAIHGKLKVQRDHFVIQEGSTGDPDLESFAEQVAELGPIPTEEAMRRLGRRLPDRIRPWKARAVRRGWLREDRRKFLGILPRSTTTVLDEEVQGKLQNRLVRMLAGGGNPDVKAIALLGLLQAAGLLPQMIPSSALAFNEKRISLLLSGRDPLHYRVDNSMRQVQDLALRTIMADVRKLR